MNVNLKKWIWAISAKAMIPGLHEEAAPDAAAIDRSTGSPISQASCNVQIYFCMDDPEAFCEAFLVCSACMGMACW